MVAHLWLLRCGVGTADPSTALRFGRDDDALVRMLGLAGEMAVAEVFGAAEREQHAAEGQSHHGDDEREPAAIGVRAVDADAAEEEACGECGEDADQQRPEGSLEERASTVIG